MSAGKPRRHSGNGPSKVARAKKKPFAIDIHSHIEIPEAAAMVAGLPSESGAVRAWAIRELPEEQARIDRDHHPKRTDYRVRLKEIDKLGFDMQALSVGLPEAFYRADAAQALEIARVCNDGIADWVSRAPDRFVGLCVVPLQDAATAAQELARAVTETGLKGAWIPSNISGRDLGEGEFRPFWAKVQELDVPVFIHPRGFTHPERMQKAMLWNTIGQPLEEALAMASLIYEGAMDAFPRIKIGICHGGGFLPYYIGRQDWVYGYRTEIKRRLTRRPSAYLRRFFYDSVVYDKDMLGMLVKKAGDTRIVMGSDFPWPSLDPVGFINGVPGLSSRARERILWRNAAKLLKLSL